MTESPAAEKPDSSRRARLLLLPRADLLVALWGIDFNPEEHAEIVRRAREGSYWPTVDVFLPVCKEPLVLLSNTWKHVAELDYPSFTVHVLDDGAQDGVRDLAAEFGFQCETPREECDLLSAVARGVLLGGGRDRWTRVLPSAPWKEEEVLEIGMLHTLDESMASSHFSRKRTNAFRCMNRFVLIVGWFRARISSGILGCRG